jgi:cell wall-associated NlpC family hydrolase
MNLEPYMKLRGDWEFPCWEWAKEVYRGECGIELPDLPVTKAETSPWRKVPIGMERPMDFLFFRKSKWKRHVGICIGSGQMAHYEEDGLGAMIERYKSVIWKNRLISVYRHDDIR